MSRSSLALAPRVVRSVSRLAAILFVASVMTFPAWAQTGSAARQPHPKSEIEQAMEGYRVSADDLQKVTAANERLATGITNNPGAVQELMRESESTTNRRNFDDVIRKVEANPVISSAIHSAGLDVRSYFVAMTSLVMAQAYGRMLQENPQAGAKMSGMLTPTQLENMKVLQAHPAEAKAFEQSLEKLKQLDDEMSRRAHGNGGR